MILPNCPWIAFFADIREAPSYESLLLAQTVQLGGIFAQLLVANPEVAAVPCIDFPSVEVAAAPATFPETALLVAKLVVATAAGLVVQTAVALLVVQPVAVVAQT